MTPNQLEETARAMLELYAQAEEKILRAVARRAARGIDTPGWAERKLGEMQELQQQLRKEIEELARQSAELRNSLIEAAYNSGWEDFDREYAYMKGGNIDAIPPARFNATGKLTSELDKSFDALHSAILRTTNDAYRDVIGKAVSMQSTGAITTRQAIKQALNEFADRGITGFTDRAGRHWHMDSYAEMAVRTGMMRASTQGYMDDALAHGENLVIISDHQDTCPLCIDWERTVLALDDAGLNHPDCDGSLADAEAAGLFHPNCLHSMTVYIPGLSIKASGKSKQGYTREMDMEGYRNRQQQRHMERQVRNWKRRQAVATTPEDERYAKAKVQIWQRRLMEHTDKTKLPRLYYREGGKVLLSAEAKKMKPLQFDEKGRILKNSRNLKWLRAGYDAAVEKGDLSALTGFEHYVKVAEQVEKELVGQVTSDGIEIVGYVTHFLDRVIGSYIQKRREVSIDDIKEALKSRNVVSRPRHGKPAHVYLSDRCDVTVNPETGLLIQTTPQGSAHK